MSYNQLVPRSEKKAIFNDIATMLKLEVVEAYDRKDVGKGIRGLIIMSCVPDIIEILKKKATTAMCMPLESLRKKGNNKKTNEIYGSRN
jgi:hypothetical protein